MVLTMFLQLQIMFEKAYSFFPEIVSYIVFSFILPALNPWIRVCQHLRAPEQHDTMKWFHRTGPSAGRNLLEIIQESSPSRELIQLLKHLLFVPTYKKDPECGMIFCYEKGDMLLAENKEHSIIHGIIYCHLSRLAELSQYYSNIRMLVSIDFH